MTGSWHEPVTYLMCSAMPSGVPLDTAVQGAPPPSLSDRSCMMSTVTGSTGPSSDCKMPKHTLHTGSSAVSGSEVACGRRSAPVGATLCLWSDEMLPRSGRLVLRSADCCSDLSSKLGSAGSSTCCSLEPECACTCASLCLRLSKILFLLFVLLFGVIASINPVLSGRAGLSEVLCGRDPFVELIACSKAEYRCLIRGAGVAYTSVRIPAYLRQHREHTCTKQCLKCIYTSVGTCKEE